MQRSYLRFVLLADALASGATGLLSFVGAGVLDDMLGLPTNVLRCAGLILILYAAIVALVGTRPGMSRSAVWAIIACNGLWAAATA